MSDLINDIFSKAENFGQTESSAVKSTDDDENKVSESANDVIARIRAKAQANNIMHNDNQANTSSASDIIAKIRARAQTAANNGIQKKTADPENNSKDSGNKNHKNSIADIMAEVMSTSDNGRGKGSSDTTEDILAMVRESVGAKGELPKIENVSKKGDTSGSIFDELENINLNELYDVASEVTKTDRKINKSNLPSPEECLYDKTYECPCCDKEFKARVVRKNKARLESVDIDLKNNYVPIQPDYYDIIMCENCGYAAVSSKFNQITDKQAELIKENITKKYIHKKYPDIYDIDTALERFKIALLNAMAKKAKSSEKALLCLKIAWIYRDKTDKQNEINYLKSAYEGFMNAFTNESFPIFGMDENTVMYLMAALSYKLGDYDDAKRNLGKLLVRRGIAARLRERAENLRDIIRSKEKNNGKK